MLISYPLAMQTLSNEKAVNNLHFDQLTCDGIMGRGLGKGEEPWGGFGGLQCWQPQDLAGYERLQPSHASWK